MVGRVPSRTFFGWAAHFAGWPGPCAQQASRRGWMGWWSERATREWMAIKRSPWGQPLVKRMCRQLVLQAFLLLQHGQDGTVCSI